MYDTTKVNTVRLWRTFVRAERVPMDTSGLCPEELYHPERSEGSRILPYLRN